MHLIHTDIFIYSDNIFTKTTYCLIAADTYRPPFMITNIYHKKKKVKLDKRH